jgi:hypothetical protein
MLTLPRSLYRRGGPIHLYPPEGIDLSPGAVSSFPPMNEQWFMNSAPILNRAAPIVPGTETATHKGLVKTVVADIKGFIAEHKTIIYSVIVLLLIDHFFLGGKLKERIKASAEKLFGVVEKKIEGIGADKPALPPS